MAKVFPALVIGIGGTGQAILHNVKSRLAYKFGSLKNISDFVKFLALDTDNARPEGLVDKRLWSGELEFGTDEFKHLSVSAETVSQIKENLSHYYPHFSTWLDPAALEFGAIFNGAGQVRQRGRLALAVHYEAIRQAVRDQLQGIRTGATSRTKDQDAKIVADLERCSVFVVGSLYGGTGSGICLDLGYLLRTLQDERSWEFYTYGIFLVPQANVGFGDERTRALCFAALRELNYFSDSRGGYEFTVKPDGMNEMTFTFKNKPPYDFPYLIAPDNGTKTLDRPKLCDMAGQRIFLQITNEIFTAVKSDIDNAKTDLPTLDTHGCPQHFLTFGISTIEVPVQAIVNACGALMLRDMYHHLQGKEPTNALSDTELGQFLRDAQLTPQEIYKALVYQDKSTIEAVIDQKATRDPLTYGTTGLLQKLRDIEKFFDEQFSEGNTPGDYPRVIKENYHAFQKKLRERILQATRIVSRDSSRGFFYARKLLAKLKLHLEVLRKGIKIPDEKTLKGSQQAVGRARADLEEILKDGLLIGWKQMASRDFLQFSYGPLLRQYLKLRLDVLVQKCLDGVWSECAEAAQEVLRKSEVLAEFLRSREDHWQIIASVAKESVVPVNGELLYSMGDRVLQEKGTVEDVYEDILTGEKGSRNLSLFLDENLKLQGEDGKFDLFLLKKNRNDLEHLESNLYELAKEKVKEWRDLDNVKALKEFYGEKVKDPQRLFDNVEERSKPFLHFDDYKGKELVLVGFQGANGATDPLKANSLERRFFDQCVKKLGQNRVSAEKGTLGLDEGHQVIFYQQRWAFPIHDWIEVGDRNSGLRSIYEKTRKTANYPLHISKDDVFGPIKRPDKADIERAKGLLFLCSLPRIEIIQVAEKRKRSCYILDTFDGPDRVTAEYSGTLDEAALQLCQEDLEKGRLPLLDRKLVRRREELGDREFAFLLITARNALKETVEQDSTGKFFAPRSNPSEERLKKEIGFYTNAINDLLVKQGLRDLARDEWEKRQGAVPKAPIAPQVSLVEPALAAQAAPDAPPPRILLCPACKAPVKDGAKFCADCGSPAQKHVGPSLCPNCSKPVDEGKKFCGECGASIDLAPTAKS